jgi:hypothetical protein
LFVVFWFVCFWQGWGLNLGLALAKQALYHLSHTPSPFAFSFFFIQGLVLFSLAGLRPGSSYLHLPSSWNNQHVPWHPPCFWNRAPGTMIILSASRVSRIRDVHCHTQPLQNAIPTSPLFCSRNSWLYLWLLLATIGLGIHYDIRF